jgi:ABC-type multidrug transport system ATPase subunit
VWGTVIGSRSILSGPRTVRRAVDGVSFDVEEGEIFGIVGPNGAGKTTIVESVEGLRHPDAGSIPA